MAKGFRDVINGSANGAGIVLPDSQTVDYAVDQIGKYGLLQQQNYLRQKQYKAQMNKDFADNVLKLPPGLQYQTELNGLAQKWYDKGVQYRKQGFDPFNADYSRPDQAAAAQEYMSEMQHIKNLSDLQKGVDADYKTKQSATQEGKLDGFDEYHNALTGHTLQSLYAAGGINALPNLYKPMDLNEVDKDVNVKPQTREVEHEISPGVTDTRTEHYLNIPQVANAWESNFINKPGVNQYLAKKGIGNPKGLYTYMGHNMQRDPNNVEEYGHIDEPGIYHQMTADYLTDPHLIKQLPDGVKQRIIGGQTPEPWVGGSFNAAQGAKNTVPYSPVEDPEFKQFIDKKFDDQITKERSYQNEIQSGVMRKLQGVDLGSTSKLDATMAHLALSRQNTQMGWARLKNENSNADIARQRWAARNADVATREKWITDIQNNHPDAISTLESALTELPGAKLERTKSGATVTIPEIVPNIRDEKTGRIDLINPKKQIMHEYKIDKQGGRGGRMLIEQILNKLPTVGKEKALKTEPYSPDYNDIGTSAPSTKDDNSADNL